MKKTFLLKTMLLLCALVAGSASGWAEDPEVTLDFTSQNNWDIPTSGTNTTENSYTDGNYTIKLCAVTNYKLNNGYLILGKKDSYLELPAFDFDVEKIEVLGHSGASGYVKQNIYVGSTAVSTETTGANGVTNTYTIADDYQSAGNVYKLVITSAHNTQIDYIKIYKKASGGGSTVAAPSFDPAGDTYTSAQNVTISCATEGATIYYTTDGNDPTESSIKYSSAISITTSGTVLKAKAFKGEDASSVATATYYIKPNAPTITGGANVTITGDDGLTFYYTTNGDNPTNSSTEYTEAFTTEDCTIKAIAYDTYGNSSAVTSLKYKYMPLAPKNINSGYFVKVTDASDLENGDAILIVNETGNVAMSTTQNNNNRGQADVTISNETILPSANVQKLVLVKKTEKVSDVDTDVFYFYTGSGYLYAASSGSNYLKTEDAPDDNNNARATIEISEGNATITFKGTNNKRNLLRYNSNNSIFSCYGSGQDDIQIYKEVSHSEILTPSKQYTTLTSAFNLDFTSVSSDLKAYIATEISGGSVQMTQVNKVPAGTGLVLKATTPGSPVDVPVFDGTDADDVSANKMLGSATETTPVAENAGYILSNGVFQPSAGGELPAGKAYLNIAVPAGSPVLTLSFGGETTGISQIENGKLRIENVYNLNGQRVAQPSKGLYIMNGRKVVIK